jgi:hypothetical protein
MKKPIVVEGRELEVYYKNLSNSSYVVYDDKIWRIVFREKYGANAVMGLERELHKEKIFIKGDELNKVLYILTYTGHINI